MSEDRGDRPDAPRLDGGRPAADPGGGAAPHWNLAGCLSFYRLQSAPFGLLSKPGLPWLGQRQLQVLDTLVQAIRRGGGIAVLTGETGVGKSTLVDRAVQMLAGEPIVIGRFSSASLRASDLSDAIAHAFGISEQCASPAAFATRFWEFLGEARTSGRRVALIVDEAHELGDETLQEILALVTIAPFEGHELSLVLVGQSDLLTTLAKDEHAGLNQRVTERITVDPLTPEEVGEYVQVRLDQAGAERPVFTPEAVRQVAAVSRGVPGVIEVICEGALWAGHARGATVIGADVIADWAGGGEPAEAEQTEESEGLAERRAVRPTATWTLLGVALIVVMTLGVTAYVLRSGGLAGSITGNASRPEAPVARPGDLLPDPATAGSPAPAPPALVDPPAPAPPAPDAAAPSVALPPRETARPPAPDSGETPRPSAAEPLETARPQADRPKPSDPGSAVLSPTEPLRPRDSRSSPAPTPPARGRGVRPADPTQAPRAADIAPRDPTQAPRAVDVAPRDATQAPRAGDVAPRDATQAPRTVDVAPRDPTQAPRTVDVAPRDPTQAPRAADVAPRDPMQAPRTFDVVPGGPTQAPRAVDVAPRNPNQAPRARDVAPAEPRQAPAAQDARPEPERSRVGEDAGRGAGPARKGDAESPAGRQAEDPGAVIDWLLKQSGKR